MRGKRRSTAAVAVVAAAVGLVVLGPGGATSHATVATGATIRSSLADHATEGSPNAPISADPGMQDGASLQALSADGRYEAFISDGPDWTDGQIAPGPGGGSHPTPFGGTVPNDTVYVRDLQTGQTSQVSLGVLPAQRGRPAQIRAPNDNSEFPSISADGRYVSFVTLATNIGGQASGDAAVVVCDRDTDGARNPDGSYLFRQPPATGAYPSFFACVTLPSYPSQYSDPRVFPGLDGWPRLAGGHDGLPLRIVWGAPASDGDEIITYFAQLGQDPLTGPVSVVDLLDNQLAKIEKIVGDAAPDQPDFLSLYDPAISDDGGSIVVAVNFPAYVYGQGSPTNVILRFTVDSVPPAATSGWPLRRVDKSTTTGFVGSSDVVVQHPQVSDGGSHVVFDTTTVNALAFTGKAFDQTPQVYAVDASRRALTSVLVSVDKSGAAADGALPAMSADGRYVAFYTDVQGMTDATIEASPVCNNGVCATCLTYYYDTSGSSSTPPPPPGSVQRTPCQLVERDLVVDGPALAAGRAPGPAQLATPSINLDCGSGQPVAVCDSDGEVHDAVSVSASGGAVAYVSAADDLVDTSNDRTDGFPPTYAYVHTWTPTLRGSIAAFGNVAVGDSRQQDLTLSVDGFGPVTIGSITVTGPDAGDFAIGPDLCTGQVVNQGAPCLASVSFAPGALGTRTATIEVSVTDPTTGKQTILTVPVTGTGSATPATGPVFAADPQTLNFGANLPLDVPGRTKPVVISNPGGAVLTLTDVAVQDTTDPGAQADYAVDATDCVGGVAPGGSCTVDVTFRGHAVGRRDAVLVFTDNAPGGPQLVGLTGRVPKPTVTANPGVIAPGRVVLIEGTGFAPHRSVDVGFLESDETASPKADAHGKFTVAVVILGHGQLGPRTVTAQTHNASPTISAQGPLLVQLGSVEILQTDTRH